MLLLLLATEEDDDPKRRKEVTSEMREKKMNARSKPAIDNKPARGSGTRYLVARTASFFVNAQALFFQRSEAFILKHES